MRAWRHILETPLYSVYSKHCIYFHSQDKTNSHKTTYSTRYVRISVEKSEHSRPGTIKNEHWFWSPEHDFGGFINKIYSYELVYNSTYIILYELFIRALEKVATFGRFSSNLTQTFLYVIAKGKDSLPKESINVKLPFGKSLGFEICPHYMVA